MFPELLDPDLLGDDDVLDDAADGVPVGRSPAEGAPGFSAPVFSAGMFREPAFSQRASTADEFAGPRVGAPWMGGAKVPLANLDPPSSARMQLTPSPVPRVSLAPATGAVDISLVPGPNARLSRNLPTLAAQHVLGRRQPRRAAAPAVTIPPTSDTTPREQPVPSQLDKDVRSSKREVVLGLTIGLGLSLLLAAAGQAYLREDVIAEAPGSPGLIESITLSARPEADVADPTAVGMPGDAEQAAAHAVALSNGVAERGVAANEVSANGLASNGLATNGLASKGLATNGAASSALAANAMAAGVTQLNAGVPAGGPLGFAVHRPSSPSSASVEAQRIDDGARAERQALVARARTEPARHGAERPPSRAVRERAVRRAPPSAAEPPLFELEKPSSEAPHERASMSPAESAGLGLDLPL